MQQVRKLLTSRKAREAAGLFVSDGTKLLKEAAAHCPGLETAFLCDGVEVELPENVRVVRVSKEVMEAISPMETPQGAVFLCRLPEKKSFVSEKGMLLLDGIQDPGNVGTILGVATGVAGIPRKYLDPINDAIVCSGISGYLNILDIPSFCRETALLGYRIAGEEAPQDLKKAYRPGEVYFDFELPGSTHNIRLSDPFRCRARHSTKHAYAGTGSGPAVTGRSICRAT